MGYVFIQTPLVSGGRNSTQVKWGICEYILVGWKGHRIEEQPQAYRVQGCSRGFGDWNWDGNAFRTPCFIFISLCRPAFSMKLEPWLWYQQLLGSYLTCIAIHRKGLFSQQHLKNLRTIRLPCFGLPAQFLDTWPRPRGWWSRLSSGWVIGPS